MASHSQPPAGVRHRGGDENWGPSPIFRLMFHDTGDRPTQNRGASLVSQPNSCGMAYIILCGIKTKKCPNYASIKRAIDLIICARQERPRRC